MIGHNVKIGKDCLVVSQVGISGSTVVGDRVTLAGQVGTVGHISICDDVIVLGKRDNKKYHATKEYVQECQ